MPPLLSSVLRIASKGGKVSDDFNRTVSGSLGVTSVGGMPWSILAGAWSVNGSMPSTSTSPSSNPLAVLNPGAKDVSVTSTIGTDDAIYFRVQDATNWWRLTYQGYQSSSCSTCYQSCCGTCQSYCYHTLYGCYGRTNSTQTYHWGASTACDYCPACAAGYSCTSKDQCYEVCSTYSCNCVDCNPYSCNCSYYDNYIWMLQRSINNSVTNISNGYVGSYSATGQVDTSGNTITLTVNGSQVYTTSDYTDFNTATKHGIGRASYYGYNSSYLDNFSLSWK